jgi:hypothetical protein
MQYKKPMLNIVPIDYLKIAKQINEEDDVLYYEKDGFILTIYYLFKIEGYRENDYFNGTGGFVETSRDFRVYDVECVDEDSNDAYTDFDENKLESYVM